MNQLKYSVKTMIKDELQKERLLELLEDTATGLLDRLQKFNEVKINLIPFANSWTAAQVADHLTQSNNSIAKALLLNGTNINRNPGERVEELKTVFLNFNTKLKSPDFILPTKDIYEREVVVQNLEWSLETILKVTRETELSEMINHRAFGDITKFEILYFVHYHTRRHMHQMDQIFEAIKDR